MAHGGTLAVVLAATLAACALAKCPACKFQWTEHGGTCYRFFADPLPYEEAGAFCRRLGHRGGRGSLATAREPEDILFLSKFADGVLSLDSATGDGVPSFIWLNAHAVNATVLSSVPILNESLSRTTDVSPCESNTVANNEAYQVQGTAESVSGPELVGQPCAVHVPLGSFLDLGDFAGTCVSDPALCESARTTWSVWLNIDPPEQFTGKTIFFYVSSGGQTAKARGIAFLYKTDAGSFFVQARRNDAMVKRGYDGHKIPQGEWFHLAFAIDMTDSDVQLFVNGKYINADLVDDTQPTHSDLCTHLYLGTTNTCGGTYSAETYGGPASFSDLAVFDGLLSSQQIVNLFECGTTDWRPTITNATTSTVTEGVLVFECTAEADVITWSLLPREYLDDGTTGWRNLTAADEGAGYTIQAASASRCAVRATLEIGPDHDLPLEGALVACTARSSRLRHTESALVYRGQQVNLATNDHGFVGLNLRSVKDGETQFTFKDGHHTYTYCDGAPPTVAPNTEESCLLDQQAHPFICETYN